MSELREIDLAELIPADKRGLFENCRLIASERVLKRITVRTPDVPGPRQGYTIRVTRPDFRGRLSVLLGPGGGDVAIDTGGPMNVSFRLWRRVSVHVGAHTTITEARIICDHADVEIGTDNLWSDEIIVQSNDQHGLVDLTTGALLNTGRRRTRIGDHVWIGRRTLLMPDVTVGRGAVLAAGAVLTSDMDANSIFAGVPARRIRENVTWARSPAGFSEFEQSLFPGLGPADPAAAPGPGRGETEGGA